MQPWIKAGLIGAAFAVVLDLLGLVSPLISCCAIVLIFLVYIGVGVLTAYWMPGATTGTAAGQGALAGLVTGIVSGLVSLVLALVRTATVTSTDVLSQFTPQQLEQLRQAGIDPSTLAGLISGGAGPVAASLCCGADIVLGVVLALLGAVVYAAIRGTSTPAAPPSGPYV
jgi:hypothetical protein